MNHFYDIAIIGGGPSGCMAALAAKKEAPNLKVVIIEAHELIKHRIGEALLTGTIMSFEEVGITKEIAKEKYHKKIGATYVWGKDRTPWYVNYENQMNGYPSEFIDEKNKRFTIHVPRHVFDQKLRDLCKEKNIDFIFSKVRDITEKNNRVKSLLLENEQVVKANYFIDCSGQNAVFGRKIKERVPILNKRVAKYFYVSNINWNKAQDNGLELNRTNIVSDNNGWNWIIHLGEKVNNLTSVGCVTTADLIKEIKPNNIFKFFPELKKLGLSEENFKMLDYKGEQEIQDFYFHPDYSYKTTELDGENWAIAGDAALFLDPILSQGVTLATHYGIMRAKGAIHYLNGDGNVFQKNATIHYLNEAEILRVVVGEWYNNNKSVTNWRWKAQEISTVLGDLSKEDPIKAFRYVTNLENLRDEYDPFPKNIRRHILNHLIENPFDETRVIN